MSNFYLFCIEIVFFFGKVLQNYFLKSFPFAFCKTLIVR